MRDSSRRPPIARGNDVLLVREGFELRGKAFINDYVADEPNASRFYLFKGVFDFVEVASFDRAILVEIWQKLFIDSSAGSQELR